MNLIAYELYKVPWHHMYQLDDCQMQSDFYSHLYSILDHLAPLLKIKFSETDRPWITTYFKVLIARRQHAFITKNVVLYKVLRNRINRIRKSLRKQYCLDKVDELKHENPANRWKIVM